MMIPEGPQARDRWFAYTGGLDQVTPDLEKKPGSCIEAYNIEIPANGGYRRVNGYERFDGRPRPSESTVLTLQCTASFAGTLAVGDTLNGQTSGATGVVIYISPNRKWLALTKVTGSFSSGENLREGVTVVGVEETFSQSVDGDMANTLSSLAAANYRADIGAVPGAGTVRGVVEYGGFIYAWRNNVGGTACVMHVASGSGWTAVTLAEEVEFSNANTSVGVGDTLTQGAVSATIRKVVVRTGTLLSGTNTGVLVITGRAGGNFTGAAASSTGGGSLTLSGAQTAQAFPVNGKYGFRKANFAGSVATKCLYGWNGVGKAFEFDGTYLCFIKTGMTYDTPTHGEVHLNRLFLSFDSSVQFSAPGEPHVWSVLVGADEFAAGDTVTGLMSMPGSSDTAALSVFTRNKTLMLYGRSDDTWNLVTVLPEVGARAYSQQGIRDVLFVDDLGITSIATSDRYGNFGDAALSDLIKPWLNDRIESVSCSMVVRKENQYKVFFTDGTGVTATFNDGQLVGMLPFQLAHVMNVACETDLSGGRIFCGGTDGYVYEMNRGRSFDGSTIIWTAQTAFHHFGSPSTRKRIRRIRIDIEAPGYHTVSIGHAVGRFDPEVDYGTGGVNETVFGGGDGFDSTSIGWDVIAFDGSKYTKLSTNIDTTTTDISMIFTGSSDKEFSFTMSGQITVLTPRRMDRRA